MSLTPAARTRIEEIAGDLMKCPASEIARALKGDASSPLHGSIHLNQEGAFTAAYAPFDWINDQADVILVGVTPGLQQATDALATLRGRLASGATIEAAAEAAKKSASFKGMRTLAARLMDSLKLAAVFDLPSCDDLFGPAAGRVHSTSVLRYPVFKNSENFAGDKRILKRPMMQTMIEDHLVPELARFSHAWIVPFGINALTVLEDLATRELIDGERLLGGVLHPSGQQWNRYNVQLGMTTGAAALAVPGGRDVLLRSAALREKAARIVALRKAA
jgi:hypothetical protein